MSTTGTLDVITPEGTERYTWNGDANDRAKAKAAFDRLVATGAFLGIVQDGPGKAKQVRSFTEIEEVEKERGVVTAQISPALVGG